MDSLSPISSGLRSLLWLDFPADYFRFSLLSLLISILLSAFFYSYPPSGDGISKVAF